jgi:hypothetical protein
MACAKAYQHLGLETPATVVKPVQAGLFEDGT